MAASPIKELYVSPNGDRWILGENQGGELVVCHHPNKRSGGAPSEIALDVFLSHGGQGPEYQALAEALANLRRRDRYLGSSQGYSDCFYRHQYARVHGRLAAGSRDTKTVAAFRKPYDPAEVISLLNDLAG